ncbi:hypothetical protein K470DRAFT_270012 [Piedraia hortae CBS 480.64]|uniref:Uncharacterized protein n=1 Tax=Piedraia hortae CBS 480.64 TaxID=1314780 RepID=A0A6A7C293_9PEZI|nr:hypothetical protein K470DRAFT_270012 [Piedraia hortae CBS 480.64]
MKDTVSVIRKIEDLRDSFQQRFLALVQLAQITDQEKRNHSAIVQFQNVVELGGLIKTGEDTQKMIRQMQEMWLFGRLHPSESGNDQGEKSDEMIAKLGRAMGGEGEGLGSLEEN